MTFVSLSTKGVHACMHARAVYRCQIYLLCGYTEAVVSVVRL